MVGDDPVLNWCRSNLSNTEKLPKGKTGLKLNKKSEGTPWDPRYSDTEFELIKVITQIF